MGYKSKNPLFIFLLMFENAQEKSARDVLLIFTLTCLSGIFIIIYMLIHIGLYEFFESLLKLLLQPKLNKITIVSLKCVLNYTI